jgi:hypothetical protein
VPVTDNHSLYCNIYTCIAIEAESASWHLSHHFDHLMGRGTPFSVTFTNQNAQFIIKGMFRGFVKATESSSHSSKQGDCHFSFLSAGGPPSPLLPWTPFDHSQLHTVKPTFAMFLHAPSLLSGLPIRPWHHLLRCRCSQTSW